MTYEYQLLGMTCDNCEAKIKSALLKIEEIREVSVSKKNNSATISMTDHIPTSILQEKLLPLGKRYQITARKHNETVESNKSWVSAYKPILLIFVYIFSITLTIEITQLSIDLGRWMRHFMAGFFLSFSFFKMLNLKGFKDSYLMYDIIARKFPAWGYVYAFTEVLLGFALLVNFNPLITHSVALTIMTLSVIGVLQTVLNKKAIKCACLGDVFNLPMSIVTIIEDGLMIIMSLSMLLMTM
ncbi:MAG: MauE/DoxX family redox-associated membrane protein [Bacteroidota bacterium]